ncbi:hypothetical protein [Exiguobacterium oxidotolerans]|uniref:Uncharacterized protein n=1 Tax=Exiguobacterium oxidotolerans TaxID=223958 RepID=A0A653IHY5_9BACL|nr:hypothetical protein [Exiguobacterium oxidotolerans]VWX38643.1 conserved membrane hypothetical protein [Exiguobacterium oxidotolerans]
MLNKFIAVVLTSVLVTGVLTYWYYTPMSERASDTMYESTSGVFIFYLFFVFPIILVAGLLTDFAVGNRFKVISSTWRSLIVQAVLYVLSGVAFGMILIFVFSKGDIAISGSLTITGSVALLYFIISRLTERTRRLA